MFTPLLFERKIFMITVYTPLSEKMAKEVLHEGIVNFSLVMLFDKILTKKDFTNTLLDNIYELVQRDDSFYSTGFIVYTRTTPKLITAIDFSMFGWINQIDYISYTVDNPPKLIKNIQAAHQQNSR